MIDFESFRIITNGDPVLETKLFGLYKDMLARVLAGLKECVASGDEKHWLTLLHELKGASANMYCRSIIELCKKAEHAQANEWPDYLAMLEIEAQLFLAWLKAQP